MSDFFSRLEVELHAAAERAPRRPLDHSLVRAVTVIVVVAVLAVVPVLLLAGGGERPESRDHQGAPVKPHAGPRPLPVGTKIPKGGKLDRWANSTVVATGTAPIVGPWQLEAYKTDGPGGKLQQKPGFPCLAFFTVAPAPVAGGGCARGSRRTPGFTSAQFRVPPSTQPRDVREVIVWGSAPEDAAAVFVTGAGGFRKAVDTQEGLPGRHGDYYLVVVPPSLRRARVNWLDRSGHPGSRGLRLTVDTKGRLF
jgi:hypothetical protein